MKLLCSSSFFVSLFFVCLSLSWTAARGAQAADCGDRFCDTASSENCATCPTDCGVCGSPQVLSSRLDSKTGSVITVLFDSATIHPSEGALGDCSTIIDTTQETKTAFQILGVNPICRWSSDDTQLSINLGFNAYLHAGLNFSFISGSITSKASSGHPALATLIRVDLPLAGLDPPVAVLTASTASLCDDVELHAELSHGAGSHALQVKWILVAPTNDVSESNNLTTYNGKLQASVWPPVGTNYTVRVQITDEYGRSASADQIVWRDPSPIPTVMIEGAPIRTITEGEDFMISIYPQEISCLDKYPVTKQANAWSAIHATWSIEPLPSKAFFNTVQLDSGMLSIPGGLLTAATYTLSVNVSYPEDPWEIHVWTQVHATLIVLPKVLLSIGGDTRLASKSSVLSLTASTDNPKTAQFTWSCQNDTGNDVITPVTGTGLYTFNTTVPSGFTADHIKCCAQVVDGGVSRTRTECCNVMLTTSQAVLPVWVVPEDANRLVSRDNKITIFGGLYITLSKVSFSWSVTPAFKLDSSTLLSDPHVSSNLVIRPGVLLPNKQYTFRLTAKTADGSMSGYAETVLTTDTEPFGGTLTINPPSGMSLNTIFTIDFENWKDPAGDDLMYAVTYLSPSLRTLIPVRWYRPKSHLVNLRLPMGLNGVLTLVGHIRNSRGTVTNINITLPITTISVMDAFTVFAGLPPEYLRCGALLDLDVCQQVCGLTGVAMPPESMALLEVIWFASYPESYNWFIDHTLYAVHNITNTDMLVRSVSGLTELWGGFSLTTPRFKNALVIYTSGLAKQIVKVGLDKQRTSITSILSVYDTLVSLVNSTAGINTTNAMAGANELVDSILADLSTHACGEEGSYDSFSMNITNFRVPEDTVTLSGKGVAVQIDQGEPCLAVQWRSYENNPFTPTLVVVIDQPTTVTVVSQVVAVLVVEVGDTTTNSSSTGPIRATSVQITFSMPSLRDTAEEWCLWKPSSGSWTRCGRPVYNFTSSKALCTCPIGGYYILGQLETRATDAASFSTPLLSLISGLTLLVALLRAL